MINMITNYPSKHYQEYNKNKRMTPSHSITKIKEYPPNNHQNPEPTPTLNPLNKNHPKSTNSRKIKYPKSQQQSKHYKDNKISYMKN